MKIVYFTSEFPGQTHIFLWREYQELLRLGVDARLVSTRAPVSGIQSHDWSAQAARDTHYLFPLTLRDVGRALVTLLRAPAGSWRRILAIVFRAGEWGLMDRVSLLVHLFMATKLVRLVQEEGCVHVHCTTCAATANIAMFGRLLAGIPYSLSLLGPQLQTYGSNQANKWRYASFALFQSLKLQRETQQLIGDAVPRLHAFAPVGVNTDVVRRTTPYRPWTPGETCVLYSCGRLHPIKGHEYVIRAVRLLIDRGYRVQLSIGGEDIEGGRGHRKVIEAEIRRLGLETAVRLLGAVSEEENIRQYETAHVYVMGSLDEAAGAVAAMEAMAMEVPVVMPDVGATAELITSGQDGQLVPAMSPVALADAIEHLLRHPGQAAQWGAQGRQTIEQRFNHHLSARVIADFLARTAGRGANASVDVELVKPEHA